MAVGSTAEQEAEIPGATTCAVRFNGGVPGRVASKRIPMVFFCGSLVGSLLYLALKLGPTPRSGLWSAAGIAFLGGITCLLGTVLSARRIHRVPHPSAGGPVALSLTLVAGLSWPFGLLLIAALRPGVPWALVTVTWFLLPAALAFVLPLLGPRTGERDSTKA